MKAHDLIELATRNLREAALRNSLTTLGVAVGVASLVAMLSLGIGLQELASLRLSRSGLFETVVVYSRRDIPSFDRAERRAGAGPADPLPLDEAARERFQRIPHVVEVYPEIRFSTEVRFNGRSHFTTVAGLPRSIRDNEVFDEMRGEFFSRTDAEEAILQDDFARSLAADPAKLVGQEIVIRYAERQPLPGDGAYGFSVVRREKPLRIRGIIENEPYSGWRSFARGRVFIPIQLAEALDAVQPSNLRDALSSEPQETTYRSLLVRVDSPANVRAVQDAVKKDGFTTWSALDATQRMRAFFVVLDLFLGIFGSLAIAVASLGIVNTLVMAILERRREIGIMKALGASDREVKRLFFAEAGVMGLVGGILGVAMGWGLGQLITFGTNLYLARQSLPAENITSVPWWLVGGAIGFAIAASLVSGLYPAARAARLDPVEALRYE